MSFKVCKILFYHKIFKALNKNLCLLDSSKLMSRAILQNIKQHADVSQTANDFFVNEHKNCCRDFIENQTCSPVQWDSLEQKLTALKSPNIRTTIIKSCQFLQKGDLAIDYCQYVMNKDGKLSLIEIYMLIKALAKCKNDLKKYDALLKTIYKHSHDTIFGIEVTVKEAVEVFSKSKSCFQDLLLKYEEGKVHAAGIDYLIAAAFDVNDPESAWKIAKKNPDKFSTMPLKSYLKFCLRLAEKNKFSINMINDLIDFSKTYTIMLKDHDFPDHINQLVEVLNKNQTEYLWITNECDINHTIKCSSCQHKLKPETVTVEELKELKKNFYEKVMICYDVNMKTSPKELEKFFTFLENCRPYDIVIDVLNLFKRSNYKQAVGRRVLSYFEKRGMKILLIGRNHFQNSEFYNVAKKKYQIFLTKNDSLDDLFCLYAAMHQGLNTYFCTSDFLRDHAKFFINHSLKELFHKWQISHQYVIRLPYQQMLQPRYHSDISQASVVLDENNEVKEYCWHLSYLTYGSQYRLETPAKWICLRAKSLTKLGKQ